MNANINYEAELCVMGITYFSTDDAVITKYMGWLAVAYTSGIETSPITPARVAIIAPSLTRHYARGLHFSSDCIAEPFLDTAAVVTGARKLCALVFYRVRGIETSVDWISYIVTGRGATAWSDVVLDGTDWSSLFERMPQLGPPQTNLQANVRWYAPVGGGPEGPGFGYGKRLNGGYNVLMQSNHPVNIVPESFRYRRQIFSACRSEKRGFACASARGHGSNLISRFWKLDRTSTFERHPIANPGFFHDILNKARAITVAFLPVPADTRFVKKIDGFVDSIPDTLRVISGVKGIPGFWISTGYSRRGFGVAPGAGRILAKGIRGKTPFVDPRSVRYARLVGARKIGHRPIRL